MINQRFPLMRSAVGNGVLRQFKEGQALAQTIRVIRGFILTLVGVGMACSASAATGSSPEFKVDLRGLGPWQRRTAAASEALTYSSAWATNAASGAKAVVKVMPVLKTKPKYLVIDLNGGTNATSYGISYLDEVPGGRWSDEYKTSKLVLRHIPAGSFVMGGRATDYPGAVNTNLHLVTITRDFYMGVFEVTQRQWELVMGTRPSSFTNETAYSTRPVETLTWDVVRGGALGENWPFSYEVDYGCFMDRLRRKTELRGFDLPTEAQWEYACRAGTTTALYTGANIIDKDDYAELNKIAHSSMLSGWDALGSERSSSIVSNGFVAISELWPEANIDSRLGTAMVGCYLPNEYGLYDLYGNVMEWCLDRFCKGGVPTGSVDPVGEMVLDRWENRAARGNSFVHGALSLRSSLRSWKSGNGFRNFDCGFRLCLQGGDIPDLAAATSLVNESEAGSQSWTPTRSGAYYLTHSTMNGTTNVQLASAWFEVPGPTLTLEPQGELTNGVSVAIGGAEDSWKVYYTTDGSVPTTNATAYVGAFSLPQSVTVRAVAYNAQGVASEETMTTFTLHDALSVVGAVARPRYPWNGMVDVDVEIKGDPERQYLVELEALDVLGKTNLPVKTVSVGGVHGAPALPLSDDSGHAGRVTLPPGRYRLTWNADADIVADGDFPQVAVTVKAVGSEIEGLVAYDSQTVTSGVVITWSEMSAVQCYNIYRHESEKGDVLLSSVLGTQYEDNTITNSGIYSYFVRPVFANGVEGTSSKTVSAKCYRVAVSDGAVFYLPMDGDAKNYGTIAHTMTMWGDTTDWFWLEDRYGSDQGSYYCTTLDHYMLLPSCDAFAVTNSFTVSFWAKSESALSAIVEEKAEGMYGVEELKYPYVLYSTKWSAEDESLAGFCVAVGTNGVVVTELSSWWFPAPLVYEHEIGTGWNHFAVKIDDNSAPMLFVNGEHVRTGLKTAKLKKISAAAIGGDFNYGAWGKYKGYVDDFLIYDRALTTEEIKTIYLYPNHKIGGEQ